MPQPILIVKLKEILMEPTTLLDPPIPSRDSRCTDRKCLTKKKCTKDQLKLRELIQIENGLVMWEPLTKKPWRSWEFKWQKNNKTQQKFLSNQRKSQLHCSKIPLSKTKSDYWKSKLINKPSDLKAEEKEQNLTLAVCKKWLE